MGVTGAIGKQMTLHVSPTSHDWIMSPQAGMKPLYRADAPTDSRNVLGMKLCHTLSFIDFNKFLFGMAWDFT